MIRILDKFIPSVCVLFSVLALFAALYMIANADEDSGITNDNLDQILFEKTVTDENLILRYHIYRDDDFSSIAKLEETGERSGKVKILIVPGHDDEYPGAQFKKTKEKDLTLKVAEELKSFLDTEKGVETFITRDKNGYVDTFQKYFSEKEDEIVSYRELYQSENSKREKEREVEPIDQVDHKKAPGDVAYKLYGINKWVEDNKIDIVIHVHFNDYPRRPASGGKYSGFSIYVPDESLRNGEISQSIAPFIRNNLSKLFAESNLDVESKIIIPDRELVAVGSNNTVQAAAMLIEYGYIYEPQFSIEGVGELVMRELAYQTYAGLREFFSGIPSSQFGVSTLIKNRLERGAVFGDKYSDQVLSLQAAMAIFGYYPEKEKTLNECPISGNFGKCTVESLKLFQGSHGLESTGRLTEETVNLLNERMFGRLLKTI